MAKLWGGRFTKDTDKAVEDFTSSIAFDAWMYAEDIAGISTCYNAGKTKYYLRRRPGCYC